MVGMVIMEAKFSKIHFDTLCDNNVIIMCAMSNSVQNQLYYHFQPLPYKWYCLFCCYNLMDTFSVSVKTLTTIIITTSISFSIFSITSLIIVRIIIILHIRIYFAFIIRLTYISILIKLQILNILNIFIKMYFQLSFFMRAFLKDAWHIFVCDLRLAGSDSNLDVHFCVKFPQPFLLYSMQKFPSWQSYSITIFVSSKLIINNYFSVFIDHFNKCNSTQLKLD